MFPAPPFSMFRYTRRHVRTVSGSVNPAYSKYSHYRMHWDHVYKYPPGKAESFDPDNYLAISRENSLLAVEFQHEPENTLIFSLE